MKLITNRRQITLHYPVYENAIQSAIACRKSRIFIISSLVISAFIQMFIETSFQNIFCVYIVLLTSLVSFHFVLRAKIIRTAPLPTLVVLGFNISTTSGALIVQTLDLRSLVYNLKVPETTFTACAIFQLSLLIALLFFVHSPMILSISKKINHSLFKPMGLMVMPEPNQLWLMGIIGSLIMGWTSISRYGEGSVQYGDIVGKFLFGLVYLAYAPYLIPFVRNQQAQSKFANKKQTSLLLLFYTVFLIILGISRNSRGTFVMGVANLGIISILFFLLGQLVFSLKLRRRLVMYILLLVMSLSTLSDLAIAMVIVRSERYTSSGTELVLKTLDTFQDKQSLNNYRKSAENSPHSNSYDENYITSIFLSRFILTKFFDNTLSLEETSSSQHSEFVWRITKDMIAAQLPTPLIRILGLNIDKNDLEMSIGDTLYYAEYSKGLGGYRQGSPIGHGIAMVGTWIYVIIIPFIIFDFIFLQSLTSSYKGFITIVPTMLLNSMSIFSFAAGDSLIPFIGLIIRQLPQNILLYWFILHITRFITSCRNRKKSLNLMRVA